MTITSVLMLLFVLTYYCAIAVCAATVLCCVKRLSPTCVYIQTDNSDRSNQYSHYVVSTEK